MLALAKLALASFGPYKNSSSKKIVIIYSLFWVEYLKSAMLYVVWQTHRFVRQIIKYHKHTNKCKCNHLCKNHKRVKFLSHFQLA